MTSLELLNKQAENYQTLSHEDKKKFLQETYFNEGLSYTQIAEMVGTYPNKVRRDALKLGIDGRTRSEAQALALNSGRREHPTAGKERSKAVKDKIGRGVSKTYDESDNDTKKRRSELGKQKWDNLSEEQKTDFHRAAARGVRKAAVSGSKLEIFLFNRLIEAGYKTDFHKEHSLQNDLLQIDLFLPELNIAIEIDGPSHLKRIWTQKVFNQRIHADNEKTALILSKGLVLIRVLQKQNLTLTLKNYLCEELLKTVKNIKECFPDRENRHVVIQ
jgi:very-short-patch-repair endonuclease